MSTQPNPTPAPAPVPFRGFDSKADYDAFVTDMATKAMGPALVEALKPLSEKQTDLMREMIDEQARTRARGDASRWPKGLRFARQARAMAMAAAAGHPKDPEAARSMAAKAWGDDDPAVKGLDGTIALQKAVSNQASNPSSLGNIVIPEYSLEFIELLRNKTIIDSIARHLPMVTGSLTLRRHTAGGIAYYMGEGLNITPSQQSVNLMTFNRKKLAALTVQSNDLVRYAGPDADQFVLDDLLQVAAIRKDLALIRGDGTEFTPKGIRNWTDSANIFNQTGTTLATIDADFAKALRLIEEANIDPQPDSIHWLVIPRTWFALWNIAPATDAGARPYREELRMREAVAPQGRILGYPVHKTNQIPKTLGGGANETETYCVHGPSLMVAETLNVQVDVFPGGAYHDGSTVVSGISTDETPIRVLMEHDFNMRHTSAAAIITAQTIQ